VEVAFDPALGHGGDMRRSLRGEGLVVLAVLAVGCGDDPLFRVANREVVVDTGTCPESRPALSVCSDAQVLAIAIAADDGEVIVAQSVRERLATETARDLADLMIADHQNLSDAAWQVAAGLGIMPEDSGLSLALADEARGTVSDLVGLSGEALDRAYVEHLVLDHLADLGVADHLLAPSASADVVIDALAQQRAFVADHLQRSSAALTELEGACGQSP
jgi:predicted outer membrane protein